MVAVGSGVSGGDGGGDGCSGGGGRWLVVVVVVVEMAAAVVVVAAVVAVVVGMVGGGDGRRSKYNVPELKRHPSLESQKVARYTEQVLRNILEIKYGLGDHKSWETTKFSETKKHQRVLRALPSVRPRGCSAAINKTLELAR